MKRRKRRNSIGTVSSASDSFRTVTPLDSDVDDLDGVRDESFEGGMGPLSMKTSTPRNNGQSILSVSGANYTLKFVAITMKTSLRVNTGPRMNRPSDNVQLLKVGLI